MATIVSEAVHRARWVEAETTLSSAEKCRRVAAVDSVRIRDRIKELRRVPARDLPEFLC